MLSYVLHHCIALGSSDFSVKRRCEFSIACGADKQARKEGKTVCTKVSLPTVKDSLNQRRALRREDRIFWQTNQFLQKFGQFFLKSR